MSNETRFHLDTVMESTIDVIQECLEKMRNCCELEIPFYVASEMESTIDVIQECFKEMRRCCELAEKLTRLKSYKREGNMTKMMLILTTYGSKDKFEDVVAKAITSFDKKSEKLANYVQGIEAMLETESYKCPKCQGIGNLSRWVYIREKGTPTQRILQSIRCEECNGTGAVTITTEVLRSLHAFANAANGIIVAIRDFNRSLNDFASP